MNIAWRLALLLLGWAGLALSAGRDAWLPAGLAAGAGTVGVVLAARGKIRPYSDAWGWLSAVAGLVFMGSLPASPAATVVAGLGLAALAAGLHIGDSQAPASLRSLAVWLPAAGLVVFLVTLPMRLAGPVYVLDPMTAPGAAIRITVVALAIGALAVTRHAVQGLASRRRT